MAAIKGRKDSKGYVEKESDLRPIIVAGMVLFGAAGGAIGVVANKKRKK